MSLRRMLASLGEAAPAVDTVLIDSDVRPGGMLSGEVYIEGGGMTNDVEYLAVDLVGALVSEDDDGEYAETVGLGQTDLVAGFVLEAHSGYSAAFSLQLPWDTPLTHVYGQRLDGMELGLRTELGMAGARDQGDLDAVRVHPLPAQEVIFEALEKLGFRFNGAELELGELDLPGVQQTLPCFQEIEFGTPHQYADIEEIDLTFVAGPYSMEVVLALDKRGGLLRAPHEELQVFTVDYATVHEIDWPGQIHEWLRQSYGVRGFVL